MLPITETADGSASSKTRIANAQAVTRAATLKPHLAFGMTLIGKARQRGGAPGVSVPGRCRPAEEDEVEDEFAENSSGGAAPKAQNAPILSGFPAGGAEGGRTPDLLIANEALSQLSYGPDKCSKMRRLRVSAI